MSDHVQLCMEADVYSDGGVVYYSVLTVVWKLAVLFLYVFTGLFAELVPLQLFSCERFQVTLSHLSNRSRNVFVKWLMI